MFLLIFRERGKDGGGQREAEGRGERERKKEAGGEKERYWLPSIYTPIRD